jgi:transcriptional regulator with XRE-family HTH domain
MVLLRRLLGEVLRRHRLAQSRTLRDVSSAAGVSLGYLSEVERGRKEASSELLASICGALEVSLADVLREVSDLLTREERKVRLAPIGFGTTAATAAPRQVAGIAPMYPARYPANTERPATPPVPVARLSATHFSVIGPVGSPLSAVPVVAA